MKLYAVPFFALAFLTLAGCPGITVGNKSGTTGMGGGPVDVNMTEQLTFSPQVAQVMPGQQILFSNTAMTHFHSATGDSSGGPNSDSQFPQGLAPGQQYTFTVPANAAAGSKIFYHCKFHGAAGNGSSLGFGMAGEIDVK